MKSGRIDETGNAYGRLTVKSYAETRGKTAFWFCMCVCGGTLITSGTHLRTGRTKSCGCLRTEATANMGRNNTTHGHTRNGNLSREFVSWRAMLYRCLAPNCHAYPRYGGATPPVKVCKRWMQFKNFLKDMGVRPKDTSLGRFLDIGNYVKENCAWMTSREQAIENWKKRRMNHGVGI